MAPLPVQCQEHRDPTPGGFRPAVPRVHPVGLGITGLDIVLRVLEENRAAKPQATSLAHRRQLLGVGFSHRAWPRSAFACATIASSLSHDLNPSESKRRHSCIHAFSSSVWPLLRSPEKLSRSLSSTLALAALRFAGGVCIAYCSCPTSDVSSPVRVLREGQCREAVPLHIASRHHRTSGIVLLSSLFHPSSLRRRLGG